MSELWVPGSSENFDVDNVFQMAKLLQNELEEIDDFNDYGEYVEFALGALRSHVHQSIQRGETYCVDSSVALLEDRFERPVLEIENAQFYGFVSEANVLARKEYPLGLAIRMDALSMISGGDAPCTDELAGRVNVPVTRITHVEAA